MSEEWVNIGGWMIGSNEAAEYERDREALASLLIERLSEKCTDVYRGGQGSEDGDYISAQHPKGFSVFVHLDPSEVERYRSFEDKEAYVEDLLFVSEQEHRYYQQPGKIEMSLEEGVPDWQAFLKKAYEEAQKKPPL
ncbi:MAG: hypothetical protein Q4Q13_04815 [Vagococcus sp.]|nr:hypothetical protein [Vagococcus sp.]